jgi:hypothetical protein
MVLLPLLPTDSLHYRPSSLCGVMDKNKKSDSNLHVSKRIAGSGATGAVLGAVVGGPIGAVVGGALGAFVGSAVERAEHSNASTKSGNASDDGSKRQQRKQVKANQKRGGSQSPKRRTTSRRTKTSAKAFSKSNAGSEKKEK